MRKSLWIVLLLFLAFLAWAAFTPQKVQPRRGTAPAPAESLRDGELVRLDMGGGDKTVMVAADQRALDEFLMFMEANNNPAAMQMMKSGRILEVPVGTRASVIRAGRISHVIRFLDGPLAGQEAVVIAEYAHKL